MTHLMAEVLNRPNLTWLQIEREQLAIQISQEDAEFLAAEYLNEEAANPEKVKSCLRHLAGFRRCMTALGMKEPLKDYKPPSAPDGRPHPVEGGEETIDKMIEAADGDVQKEAAVAFSGYMAFRVSEGRKIRPEQIDYINWELIMIGKGGQVERFPIPRKARRPLFMARCSAEEEGRETIISASDRTVRGWWSQLLSAALGRPVKTDRTEGTHSGRHSVGTDTYNNTKDPLLTQRVLRQKDPRSMTVYVDIPQSALREALENRGDGKRSA